MLREAFEEALKAREALLAVTSAREETNVESESSIRIGAGPKVNSMAPGNAGLIGLQKDPADGKAQKCIEAQASGNAEAVCDDYGVGEVAGAKPIKVIKKENRAAAKKAKFKADRANAAEIESAQRPVGAAGSVVGCLGEEARSEGRVGRGGGGEGGLGEGGGEGQFQKLFATATGTSLPTNSLPQSSPALSPNPSLGSTLHSRA